MEQLTGNVECLIGHDRWKLECTTGYDDIVGVSFDQDPWQRVLQSHMYTLDGEKMVIPISGCKLDLSVAKSLITTVKYDPLHPKTIVKIFEFGVDDLDKINVPMMAIIPISKGIQKPDFDLYFGHWVSENDRLVCSVDSPRVRCCLNGIRFGFRGQSFLVYEYCEDAKTECRQLVVESEGAFSFAEFCECVRRILMVIGFFTGTYYLGPFWIYNTQIHNFIAYNHCMPKGGTVKYHIWSLNPYEYLVDADKRQETAKEIEKTLRPITRNHFEKLLCLLDDEKYAHFFYIFQDIGLNASHLTASAKFPIYATCLEACKEWWTQINPRHLTALFSEEQRAEIKKKIKNMLENDYGEFHDTEVCIRKIGNIFQVPNMDVLKEALLGVGLKLSKEDIDALKWRNSILHGSNIIKTSFDEHCPNVYINEVEYKLITLHELIWRFIMKTIGYDGVYVDVAKLNQLFRDHKSNGGKPLCKHV